jgi:hypothetical protein
MAFAQPCGSRASVDALDETLRAHLLARGTTERARSTPGSGPTPLADRKVAV